MQVLFIVWLVTGLASGSSPPCGSLDAQSCQNATNVGKGIGVAIIVIFWIVVDSLLALIYGIYRLAKRT